MIFLFILFCQFFRHYGGREYELYNSAHAGLSGTMFIGETRNNKCPTKRPTNLTHRLWSKRLLIFFLRQGLTIFFGLTGIQPVNLLPLPPCLGLA